MTDGSIVLALTDESATVALAADIAAVTSPGDVLALSGGLGSGKTTFARAFLRAFTAISDLEVPSPTFTLVQTYTEGRFPVAHFDLYRIAAAEEAEELGFADALELGAVLVEWPERAAALMPREALEMAFDLAGGHHRVTLRAAGGWAGRVRRTLEIRRFLDAAGCGTASRNHVQGDVSARRYERVLTPQGARIVMDWPPRDPPAATSYDAQVSRAAGAGAFVAVGAALRSLGLSTPEILAADEEHGLLLLEDFGTVAIVDGDGPMAACYGAVVDVLAHIHGTPRSAALPPDGKVTLPAYDRPVMATELTLFTTHYLPFVGARADDDAHLAFADLWTGLFDRLHAGERNWVLRDVQSSNILWLGERQGLARVGILDFQDALYGSPAYDVVSLLQDARVSVPPVLEASLRDRYIAARRQSQPDFDEAAFLQAYAVLGVQRAMKVLGIFARLAADEGRDGYLAHMPRLREYLARNFTHPVLSGLALWYEELMSRNDAAR
ncbi:MAG: tRNA (adenosine(37)-N6)-threonylcarbamoyltransferase complex ATPase subunit type 1 TsaE [Alphaproteobacteria bacterium]